MNKYKFKYQRIDPIFEVAKKHEKDIWALNMIDAMDKWRQFKDSDLYYTGDEVRLLDVTMITSNVLEVTRWIIDGD